LLASAQGQGTIVNDDTQPPSVAPFDFDGDGSPDLLWRHDSSGQLQVWLMSGADRIATVDPTVPTLPDSTWEVQAVADFNADGHVDILWRNGTSGLFSLWLMQGTTQVEEVTLDPPGVDVMTWHIRAVADFNGDGKPDILWRDEYGSIYVWFMNGTTLESGAYLNPGFALPQWRIRGTGDFNLDGKPDILWQHDQGSLYVWFMGGTSLIGGSYLNPGFVADPDWVVARVADANDDGYADILWQHESTGALYIWYMAGVDMTSGTYLNPSEVPDTLWKAVPRSVASWGVGVIPPPPLAPRPPGFRPIRGSR
jgi:serralysin